MSHLSHALAGQLRDAVAAERTELGRAQLLRDVVQVVYDTVKMNFADRGFADTAERSGVAEVSDAARHHWSKTAAAKAASSPPSPGPVRTGMTGGWLDELAEWQQDPTEAHQEAKRAALPGDANPIHLTVYEAAKCQAILTAYVNGQDLLDFAVRDVAMLLSVRSLTAAGVPHAAVDPWPRIDELPWPPPTPIRRDDR